MNRINLLKLAVILVLSAAAATTAYGTSFTGSTILGGNSFTTSNNVNISVATDGNTTDNNGFAGSMYSAKSKHQKGDKTIGCLSGDAKLYYYLGNSTADTTYFSANITDTYTNSTIWLSM